MGLLAKIISDPSFFQQISGNIHLLWKCLNKTPILGRQQLTLPEKKTPRARYDTNNMNLTCTSGHKRKKRRTKKGPERLILVSDAIDTAAVMPFTYSACMYTLIHTSSTTVQLNHCQDDTASMTQKNASGYVSE